MAHDVFISHSSRDKLVADAICAWLEQKAVRCWIAPRDIRPGAKWGASIIRAIRGSRIMILIFSRHANASHQIMREVERAVNAGVTLIPFRIEDVRPEDNLDYFLSTAHWLDAFQPPIDPHLEALTGAVKEILDIPAPLRPASGGSHSSIGEEGAAESGEVGASDDDDLFDEPSDAAAWRRAFVLLACVLLLAAAGSVYWYFGTRAAQQPNALLAIAPVYTAPSAPPTAPQSPATALPADLLSRAEAGNAAAQGDLGRHYCFGIGVRTDYPQALSWLQKSAAQGNANAQQTLGVMYMRGLGMTKDYPEAITWFQKAANQGNGFAECSLGYLYMDGFGVARNADTAAMWFRKAAAQGNQNAEAQLGRLGVEP
jgi:hypothetical protein